MADKRMLHEWSKYELVRLLQRDVAEWNERKKEIGAGLVLREAWLPGADLSGADLSEANLRGADLFETVFGNTNLKTTKNLASCNFHGPCTIDLRTLALS